MSKKLLILNAPGASTGSLFKDESVENILNNKYTKFVYYIQRIYQILFW